MATQKKTGPAPAEPEPEPEPPRQKPPTSKRALAHAVRRVDDLVDSIDARLAQMADTQRQIAESLDFLAAAAGHQAAAAQVQALCAAKAASPRLADVNDISEAMEELLDWA